MNPKIGIPNPGFISTPGVADVLKSEGDEAIKIGVSDFDDTDSNPEELEPEEYESEESKPEESEI